MNEDIINIDHVSFCYKGASKGLLNDVSLKIRKGETVLLCGASGSGKTTIIRLVNGLIPHYYSGDLQGDVTVAGRDIRNTELYDLAGVVGTVFQNPRSQFFSIDTDGEIVFGPENIGLPPEEIKKRFADVKDEMQLQELLGRSIFGLSGGEKQRIACASVSALLPEVMLLDEPSSNLDIKAMNDLSNAVARWKGQGKTVIISEHRLWYVAPLVDRVIYMENGRIAHEWTGEEFRSLGKQKIKELKLRPVEFDPDETADTADVAVSQEDAVVIRDMYFSYNEKPHVIRRRKFSDYDEKDLDLNIPELRLPKGKVIAVVGHNGTGKSTFFRGVCGLLKRCTGTITADGKVYKGKERLRLCYMVMQDVNHQLFTDSVENEVLLSMEEEDKGRCEEILDSLGILEFKDKHPMALSGGQKQRVAVASAIASGAKLLLFDEPTSGLDYSHMEKVGSLLRKLADSGHTILVSTHDPELIAESCDYILKIEDGKVESLTRK